MHREVCVMTDSNIKKDNGTRMGNPRTVPLRPEDLNSETALKKYIFPRILDIANQTEMNEEDFNELIDKFKLFWKEEKTKKLNTASKNIRKQLKELTHEEKEYVIKLLGWTEDSSEN